MHPDPRSWTSRLQTLLEEAQATGPAGEALDQDRAMAAGRDLILGVLENRRKVMVVGNGGSAAIASHLQTDLIHSLKVRALIFTEPSVLTAQANDHGYATAFSNLTELWAEPGDLMIAISSSGKSENILGACRAARNLGARIITFSGFAPGNPLRGLGDLNFHVASPDYGQVESSHAVLIHHLTDLVLAALRPETRA
jgi:D-sedoheptulose 7-phosphate isomerase